MKAKHIFDGDINISWLALEKPRPDAWQCKVRSPRMANVEKYLPGLDSEKFPEKRPGGSLSEMNFYGMLVASLRSRYIGFSSPLSIWAGQLVTTAYHEIDHLLAFCRPIALLVLVAAQVQPPSWWDREYCGKENPMANWYSHINFGLLHFSVIAHFGVPIDFNSFPLKRGATLRHASTEGAQNNSLYLWLLREHELRWVEKMESLHKGTADICKMENTLRDSRSLDTPPEECTLYWNEEKWKKIAPAVPSLDVCIDGFNEFSIVTKEFWHFFRGHFLETIALVTRNHFLSDESIILSGTTEQHVPRMLLTFGSPYYLCPTSKMLAFYALLTGVNEKYSGVFFDPGCAFARARRGAIVLRFPEIPTESVANSFLNTCQLVPPVARVLALSRIGDSSSYHLQRPPRITVVQRRFGRDFLNRDALSDHLGSLCVKNEKAEMTADGLCEVNEVFLEDLTWSDQIKQFLHADVVIGYHGAAIGSHEVWLPNGAVVIEFQPANAWFCMMAYCASAIAQRAVLFVLSTTEDTPLAFPGTMADAGSRPPAVGPDYNQFFSKYAHRRIVGFTAIEVLERALQRFSEERSLKRFEAAQRLPISSQMRLATESLAAERGAGRFYVPNACFGTALQIFEQGIVWNL